jgi:hypothetical protein
MTFANSEEQYFVHLTLKSDNQKTGPIPVSVTSSNTCPHTCSFKGSGCYAEYGPLAMHWRKVSAAERGMSWGMFCEAVQDLAPMQLWRHNAAGDLPGDGRRIDRAALDKLVQANVGKRGFTYTHYRPGIGKNSAAVTDANLRGFTVNLSAESLREADLYADLGIAPVVTVLPRDQVENTKTPAGRTVVVCPATVRDNVSCATCQLCYRQRDTIVGFPAHGTGARRIEVHLDRGDRVSEGHNA